MKGTTSERGFGAQAPDQPAATEVAGRVKTREVAMELLKQYEQATIRLISMFLKTKPGLQEADIDDATRKEIETMAAEQAAAIIERQEAHKHVDKLTGELSALQKEASVDALTGIYNRRGFEEHANQSLRSAQEFIKRQNQERTHETRLVNVFLAFDVDKFKNINDQGLREHGEGDAVLIGVGEILQKTVRPTDLIVRFGGDEFGALLLNVPVNELDSVMQRIIKSLHTVTYRRKDDPEKEIPIDMSVGVRVIEADENVNWEGIKSNADETAGLAKMRKDKKGYLVFNPEVKNETIQYLKEELNKPIEETDKFQSLLREHQRHLEDIRDLLSPAQADKALLRLKEQAREELELALAKMKRE